MINILILTHGDLGGYLLEAAEFIVGRQEGIKTVNISPRYSLHQVQQRVSESLKELVSPFAELRDEGSPGGTRRMDGLLILTDLLGGTPCNAVLPLTHHLDNVEIVCGLNLYLLISAINHRGRLTLSELKQRVIEDGKKSIVDAKVLLREKMKIQASMKG